LTFPSAELPSFLDGLGVLPDSLQGLLALGQEVLGRWQRFMGRLVAIPQATKEAQPAGTITG